TNACGVALMTTAPNRNGRAKLTGRSKKAISRTARRGGMDKTSIQRTLREKMLADALHQFGEDGIGHRIERARARQRHVVDRGNCFMSSGSMTLERMLRHGSSNEFGNTMPTLPCGLFTGSPSTRISPVDGASSPEIIFSRVDLPQPDGPTTTKNSPSLIWKSSGRSDGTSPSRAR